jgi:hypothetical protein
MDPNHPLLGLARELAAPTTPAEPSSRPRLSIVSTGDVLHVDFYGSPFEEAFETVCTALNFAKTVADRSAFAQSFHAHE